ncbi:MAG: hypothetical protein BTN85_1554 [Candidatus Methanohalarchaeum thermophilum]|uniref:Uncharacterized protein n=1 Tax=Methanohalarchaeum thermophilum TaxID=1903181 RepID=A0A1Q6DXI2_METT1|nr:MAG: hypothetical protein BTN85_1554 [Candidatus Methanohalarchaeum thermophilum]
MIEMVNTLNEKIEVFPFLSLGKISMLTIDDIIPETKANILLYMFGLISIISMSNYLM